MSFSRSALLAVCLALGPSKILALPTEEEAISKPVSSFTFPREEIPVLDSTDESAPGLVAATAPPPAEIEMDDWDVLEYYESDGGYITTYAPSDPEAFDLAFDGPQSSASGLDARQLNCGRPANFGWCWSGGDRGSASACEYLWRQFIQAPTAQNPTLREVLLPSNARHVCRGDTGGECCVTWGDHGRGAQYVHLAQALEDTFHCISNGIFARVENVIIALGPCTHQCVSGRGGHCPPYIGNTK